MRGEFIRADGLVIPNNITTYGVRSIFRWAFRDVGYALHIGLANCNPDPDLLIEELNEPTLGVNGYARQAITRGSVGWPVYNVLNGEQYFETKEFVFTATGAGFDKAITRLALINEADAVTGRLVVALSSPLPDELTITPATTLALRTFKYRIYGR